MDEGRKRVLLIAAILAARKLASYDPGAIADAVRWAEQILREIDNMFS
jgi:hypothetical protein